MVRALLERLTGMPDLEKLIFLHKHALEEQLKREDEMDHRGNKTIYDENGKFVRVELGSCFPSKT
ncbi:hypothetical protein BTIS_1692 [Bifidobacterium tissieri]|uniref:Uncharacterized protein n=2 Tax=Bifidobacterium tissieri TaxID=1630162 RepID=A0A261FCZ8_9BIFI|nr:hypothetical protein BTIS_1692 [Bifidobacterium tissieri]